MLLNKEADNTKNEHKFTAPDELGKYDSCDKSGKLVLLYTKRNMKADTTAFH